MNSIVRRLCWVISVSGDLEKEKEEKEFQGGVAKPSKGPNPRLQILRRAHSSHQLASEEELCGNPSVQVQVEF